MIFSGPDIVALILALLIAGFFAGIIAGLLGVGGGIILVPVLFQTFILFDLPTYLQIHMAVGTSLAIICFTGMQSARSHLARHAVDREIIKSWGGFIVFGALAGALAARFIAPAGLKVIFAALSLGMGVRMLMSRQAGEARGPVLPAGAQRGLSLLIGFFSALMGIGGGTLSVPLLAASGRDMHRAVGTSAALGVIVAVPATVGFIFAGWSLPDLPIFAAGYVNLLVAILMIPASMAGAPLGVSLAHRLSKRALNRIFAVFLLLSGGRMLLALII